MHGLTASVGALAFVGLVCTRAPAQNIPDEARKQLAHALQGSFLVIRDKVRDDLKMSNEQKEKVEENLKELLPDAMKFFETLKDLKPEEREKELKGYRQKAQEKLATFLKETLTDDQGKRLRQLELQQEGPFALMHGKGVGKDLKITDEQRKQFMAVVQDLQKKVEPLTKEAKSGGDPREIWPKIMKIRKEHEGKLEALLTDAQKKQWQEMLGKTLNLDE